MSNVTRILSLLWFTITNIPSSDTSISHQYSQVFTHTDKHTHEEIPLNPIPGTCFAQHSCNAGNTIHTGKHQIETKPVIKT